jgi:hypothetical protein
MTEETHDNTTTMNVAMPVATITMVTGATVVEMQVDARV